VTVVFNFNSERSLEVSSVVNKLNTSSTKTGKEKKMTMKRRRWRM
jgi:hypothetical protein